MELPVDLSPPPVTPMTFPQFCEELRGLRGQFRLRHGAIRHKRKKDRMDAFLCPVEAVIAANDPNFWTNNNSADRHGEMVLGLKPAVAERVVRGADAHGFPSYRRAMLKALGLPEELE
jgi:hypothetical protein